MIDDFVVGVPDTTLKDLINRWESNPKVKHIIATNEGEALAIGVGYFLATGNRPVVYMQSDGFCNAMNPLTSLVIPYGIPVKFIIGLRKDHPQHEVMGENFEKLREMFETEYLTFEIYEKRRSDK